MENTEKAHAVPQNIMSVEFKLIGDLSLKQFVFIAVPLTLGFIMYVFHVNNYITLVFTGFLLLIALFIDFVPIDDRPLDDLIVNFLIAIKNPTQRVWRKNPEFPNILKIPKMLIPQEKKDNEIATFMYQSPIDSNLNSPSSSDASKFLDQREKVLIDNIDKLNDSLNSIPAGNSMVSPSINNNIPTQSPGVNMNPPFVNPSSKINSNNPQNDGNSQSPNPVGSDPSILNPVYNNQPLENNTIVDKNLSNSMSVPNSNNTNILDSLRQPDPKDFYKQSPQNNMSDPMNTALLNGGNIPTVNPQNLFNSNIGNTGVDGSLGAVTNPNTNASANTTSPDQNYIDPNNSNIDNNISPIRNDIDNSTQYSVNTPPAENGSNNTIPSDINTSQDQNTIREINPQNHLDNLLDTSGMSANMNAIPHSYDYLSSSPSDPSKINDSSNFDNDIKKILDKIDRLEKENNDLKKRISDKFENTDTKNDLIDQSNKQTKFNIPNTLEDTFPLNPQEDEIVDKSNTDTNSLIENNISDQSDAESQVVAQQDSNDTNPSQNNVDLSPSQIDIFDQSQSVTGSLKKEDILKYLPDFVSNPNIISGVVMKITGEILPDTVIIIKDSSQKPVRAIKTNQLGQFFIRTPLLSGMYNLEITYQGLSFDPIFIELNDTVKEPMLIYSK